jgi:hypothetical protein
MLCGCNESDDVVRIFTGKNTGSYTDELVGGTYIVRNPYDALQATPVIGVANEAKEASIKLIRG